MGMMLKMDSRVRGNDEAMGNPAPYIDPRPNIVAPLTQRYGDAMAGSSLRT